MPKTKIYSMQTKEKARQLRKCGWSLGEISQKLNIPKNTLSGWVTEIKLTKKQKRRIKQKEIASAAQGRILAAKLLQQKMEKWKRSIRKRVQSFSKTPSGNARIGKLICGLLYICEGAKYPSSRYLCFGNSDPKIISFFIALLRKHYNIDENKLRFGISYRWDQDYKKLKKYWSKITNIPKSKCLKARPDIRSRGKPTLKENYKGVCRIIYYDTSLQFELQSIGEIIISGGAEGI